MPLILPKQGYFEFEEKRSKFIGQCSPIDNEESAKTFLNEIKKAHPKASHNVFAFAVGTLTRMSDDGEPHGTAGMPVLNVFDKTGIINYICVVTRYYGGTMLGAGGLVRAYTKAAKGAMENAEPEELIIIKHFEIVCEYSHFDTLKYKLDKSNIEILDVEYSVNCKVSVKVKEFQLDDFNNVMDYSYTLKEI